MDTERNRASESDPRSSSAGPVVGFACTWDTQRESTWSHTPWQLRTALAERTQVVDLGVDWSGVPRTALKLAAAHRDHGRWRSGWKHARLTQALTGARLRRAERELHPDVALQMGDMARLRTPVLTYHDLSFDLLFDRYGVGSVPHFAHLSPRRLTQLAARQRDLLAEAAGVLTMSRWLADHLVAHSGLPAEKVHVVPPGANVLPDGPLPRARQVRDRHRILLVGKDFHAKGGELLLAAVAAARSRDPRLRLTIAGPDRWPTPEPVPTWVNFVGRVPLSTVADLYAEHDVFVMPSRFEGFGMVLAESLAHGVPCVARRDFAMPEIVTDGHNGVLVDGDEPEELANAIEKVLGDDSMVTRTLDEAPKVAEYYTWGRAADDVLRVVGDVVH